MEKTTQHSGRPVLARANSMVATNRDQLQSYIMTSAKYDFDVYEKKILYQIISLAQPQLEGYRNISGLKINQWGDREITMALSDIGSPSDYYRIKKAFIKMMERIYQYQDDRLWMAVALIINPKIETYSGVVTFRVTREVWDLILDFTKGYTKYELGVAMEFSSVYSMRFYELMSNQSHPVVYTIEWLRERFCLTDKYKQINDLIRKVVEPARKELDRLAPFSFTWEYVKTGKKVTALKFIPVKHPENRDPQVMNRELRRRNAATLWQPIKEFLRDECGFTTLEIRVHGKLWELFQETFGELALFTMKQLWGKAVTKDHPKGYLINAARGKINDAVKS